MPIYLERWTVRRMEDGSCVFHLVLGRRAGEHGVCWPVLEIPEAVSGLDLVHLCGGGGSVRMDRPRGCNM